MISRRTLFGRMLVAASAFVVAPAVTVEAAPTQYDIEGSFPDGEPMDLMLRQVRAEGYERGRAVEQAKAESRMMPAGPITEINLLTFEAMQADCNARGCNIDAQFSIERLNYGVAHWVAGRHWADDTMTLRRLDTDGLVRVDVWRRGLHELQISSGGVSTVSLSDLWPMDGPAPIEPALRVRRAAQG